MTIHLYYLPLSPPSMSVMMLAKTLGIHLNLKLVDVMRGAHMTPKYLKMNPRHTIPTIDDNGFTLWESRPILTYLVMKYAKNDALYPKDPKKRARVEEILYLDLEMLADSIMAYYVPVILGKTDTPPPEFLPPMEKAFETLDRHLQNRIFAAGDEITIADYGISTSTCTAKALGFDIDRYENVSAWYARCKDALEKHGFEQMAEGCGKILQNIYLGNLKA